jgi:hypothetical protein
MSLCLSFLKHLAGKIHEDTNLLKIRQSGNANVEAQFFKISEGTPLWLGPLMLSNPRMHSQHQTQQTEEIQKVAHHSQDPVPDPTAPTGNSHKNFANKSQIS